MFRRYSNIIKICKIGKFQLNNSTIFLKLLNIYFFSKIFHKIKILIRQNSINLT